MNSISATGSTPLLTPAPGADSAEPSTPVQSSNTQPLYVNSFSAQGSALALGLGAPRNIGDIDAVFAEIATKLGESTTEAGDFAKMAEMSERSTALKSAADLFKNAANLNTRVTDRSVLIAEQDAIIAEKTNERNGLSATKDGLVSTRDSKQGQISGKEAQINNNNLLNTVNLHSKLIQRDHLKMTHLRGSKAHRRAAPM